MERLTDRKTAAALAVNYKALREAGQPRDIETERYIKLAEYEDQEEEQENERDQLAAKSLLKKYDRTKGFETR